jgi:hypothetical protein
MFQKWRHVLWDAQRGVVAARIALAFLPCASRVASIGNVPIRAGKRARG